MLFYQRLGLGGEEGADCVEGNLEGDDAGGVGCNLVLGVEHHEARLREVGRIGGQGDLVEVIDILGEEIFQQFFIGIGLLRIAGEEASDTLLDERGELG